ncbi:MAG: flippase [Candidatus Dormibacteria bacterium]
MDDTSSAADSGLTEPEPSPARVGPRAVRNSALILTVRVASRLVALVTVVTMGNAIGDSRFGRLQTAVTYGLLISVIADLGLSSLYVREGARHPDSINRFLNTVMSAKVLLLVACLPLLAGVLYVAGLTSLLLPTFAVLVLSGYSLLLRNTLYALQRLGFEIASIIPESLVLLVLVIAGAATHQGVAYFLWAYAISYAFTALYFAVVLIATGIIRPRWEMDLGLLRPWLMAGLPFAITYIFTTVYFKVDIPILQRFRSYQEVGWYSLAYKPFESLLFVPVTLRAVIFPIMSVYHRATPDRVAPLAGQLFKVLAALGWPLSVGTFLLAPQLNEVFHLFPQSAASLRILALAIGFMFVDNTFAATLNAIDRQKVFAYIALAGLLINVGLNLALIPPFGYLGASWAVVIAEMALVIIGWFVLRSQLAALAVWRLSWRIVVAGLTMGLFLYLIHPLGRLHLVVAIVAAAVIYIAALALVGAVNRDERRLLRSALARRQGTTR